MIVDGKSLTRLEDRYPFLFIKRSRISISDGNILIDSSESKVVLPCQKFSTLMLCSGTTITHEAIKVLAKNGVIVVWSDNDGFRLVNNPDFIKCLGGVYVMKYKR